MKKPGNNPQTEPWDDEPDDPQPARSTAYITQVGIEKLRAELHQLLTVERPKVTAEVSVAAAQGDRSENAEYIYGKKRLREIDRRLRFLQKRIEVLQVVGPEDRRDVERIFLGATVTLEDDDGSATTYQLVGPDETDARARRISVDSPLGRSLLGRKKDDVVTVVRPRGAIDVRVLRIEYL